MTRPRILRLFRIAVSVVCGILCLLLIALWLRSYTWQDWVWGRNSRLFCSYHGELSYVNLQRHFGSQPRKRKAEPITADTKQLVWVAVDRLDIQRFGIRISTRKVHQVIGIRYWLSVAITATLAVLPWIHKLPWRFSLRTLLIATALVAVVLGLVVAKR
jgi:hypothetical protein